MVSLRIEGTLAEIGLDAGRLNLVTRHCCVTSRRRCAESRTSRTFAVSSFMAIHGLLRGKRRRRVRFARRRRQRAQDPVRRPRASLSGCASLPTIAAIDGVALGGGFELALACDIRVAGQGARIGLPESRLGGLASSGAVRLARLVGPARAKEMLFTGCIVEARSAFDWGLVNRVGDDALVGGAAAGR